MPDCQKLISFHREEYGEDPEVVVSAPGVARIMGEHTESSEGYTLSFALERCALIGISRRRDNSLRFFSADGGEKKRSSLANLKYKREDRWANYPKGVISAVNYLGFETTGLNWTVLSDIPQEVGLGSSAAICAGTALAIRELFHFNIPRGHLAEAARQAEARFMNRPGYISDDLVTLYAQPGHALFVDTRTLDFQQVKITGDLHFVITNTRVPKGFSEEEFPEYARSREECLRILQKRRVGVTLRDYSTDDLSEELNDFPESSRRRCLHILQENKRVRDISKALKEGRWKRAGKMMYYSHESLRDLFEVSCPELDWLVKRAMETDGVWGARMIGEGFGGCTLTMMNSSALSVFESHLEDYDRIFGFKADHFSCEPSAGARLIFPEKDDNA